MSFHEKRAVVTLLTMLLILFFYIVYVNSRYEDASLVFNNDFKLWGKAFLILIPVMIVAQIIVHIIFIIINKIITNEDAPAFSDERDKLIELKSTRISHWVFTMGFLVSMATQAFGMEPYVMFVVMIATSFLSPTVSSVAKIIYYRKGL